MAGKGESKPPRKKGLTPKQRKLVAGMAAGKTVTEAAKAAGMARPYASEVLTKPDVQESIQSLMAKMGMDDASLLRHHVALLHADKTVSAVGGKDAGAGTVDFVDVPDWQARGKGLEMAYKLKGAFKDKVEHSGEVTVRWDE